MYGTLPVVHNTGGIHDTVDHLHYDGNLGNGFRFDDYGTVGLRWAIDEAVKFYRWPAEDKDRVTQRIMRESKLRFNHKTTAAAYIDLYSKMLGRPVVNAEV
jgi:glycogen synthase